MSQDDLTLAMALADRADAITSARFGALDLRVDTKPDLTPVTDADRAVETGVRGRCPGSGPPTASSVRSSAEPLRSPDGSGSSTRSTAPRTSCAESRCGPA